jgi:hypothetical protein
MTVHTCAESLSSVKVALRRRLGHFITRRKPDSTASPVPFGPWRGSARQTVRKFRRTIFCSLLYPWSALARDARRCTAGTVINMHGRTNRYRVRISPRIGSARVRSASARVPDLAAGQWSGLKAFLSRSSGGHHEGTNAAGLSIAPLALRGQTARNHDYGLTAPHQR